MSSLQRVFSESVVIYKKYICSWYTHRRIGSWGTSAVASTMCPTSMNVITMHSTDQVYVSLREPDHPRVYIPDTSCIYIYIRMLWRTGSVFVSYVCQPILEGKWAPERPENTITCKELLRLIWSREQQLLAGSAHAFMCFISSTYNAYVNIANVYVYIYIHVYTCIRIYIYIIPWPLFLSLSDH